MGRELLAVGAAGVDGNVVAVVVSVVVLPGQRGEERTEKAQHRGPPGASLPPRSHARFWSLEWHHVVSNETMNLNKAHAHDIGLA